VSASGEEAAAGRTMKMSIMVPWLPVVVACCVCLGVFGGVGGCIDMHDDRRDREKKGVMMMCVRQYGVAKEQTSNAASHIIHQPKVAGIILVASLALCLWGGCVVYD
jgi:hypothetical protein